MAKGGRGKGEGGGKRREGEEGRRREEGGRRWGGRWEERDRFDATKMSINVHLRILTVPSRA